MNVKKTKSSKKIVLKITMSMTARVLAGSCQDVQISGDELSKCGKYHTMATDTVVLGF